MNTGTGTLAFWMMGTPEQAGPATWAREKIAAARRRQEQGWRERDRADTAGKFF